MTARLELQLPDEVKRHLSHVAYRTGLSFTDLVLYSLRRTFESYDAYQAAHVDHFRAAEDKEAALDDIGRQWAEQSRVRPKDGARAS